MRAPLVRPNLAEIQRAAERLGGVARRTPLIEIEIDTSEDRADSILLKLENLQPIGSFKVRGAGNAIASAPLETLERGVYTASAGNMAQGLAWCARREQIECAVVVPEHAPRTKLDAIERLGGLVMAVPFDEWWRVMVEHTYPGLEGLFVHPVCEPAVVAGNATIGLELLEDRSDLRTVVVPYGGGGLSCGIAAAVKALRPEVRVVAAEVSTAAPLSAALAAGRPVPIEYQPSFVDGIGGKGVLEEMWPLVQELIDAAEVVTPAEIAAAVRLLAERSRVVAEGAGAAAVAVALAGRAGPGPVACIVSGGNIDSSRLAAILRGELPD
jgi:threonine dehydratase